MTIRREPTKRAAVPSITGWIALIVFTLVTSLGIAQTPPSKLTTLYSFQSGNDGSLPEATVVIGAGGVLYGTTSEGGGMQCKAVGCGTVFALAPPAAPDDSWAETILYNFPNRPGGGFPTGGLLIGNGGALYGTASSGGNSGWGGTVFRLNPPPAVGEAWTDIVLHEFVSGKGDGAKPYTGLVSGSDGALYGTTSNGGDYACTQSVEQGCGTVFELTPPVAPGGTWTETVLHAFTGEGGDGANPNGLVLGRNGEIYGATAYGGITNSLCSLGCGVVYELKRTAQPGGWTEIILYSFTGGSDGAYPDPYPLAGLAIGQDGALYGAATQGGITTGECTGGCGVIFELEPPPAAGGLWAQAVIHAFTGQAGEGRFPVGVISGGGGMLFGTTGGGGNADFGTVFKLKRPTLAGAAWNESVLYSFTGGADGADPFATVVIGPNGTLFGTTLYGGTANSGTVFELMP